MRVSGARLRRERERQALSVRELAEQAGISYITVWRIENETTGPTRPTTARKLSNALGVQPEALIVWDEDEAKQGKAAA